MESWQSQYNTIRITRKIVIEDNHNKIEIGVLNMAKEIPFQQQVADLMIDLSLFVTKMHPSPLVALAGFEIFKNKVTYEYLTGNKINDSLLNITNRDVRDLYDQLGIFFKELDIYDHPEAAIVVLEYTKYQFLKEIDSIDKRR